MSIALETTGLGKRYGRQWALRDCTLSLPVGRVAGRLGTRGGHESEAGAESAEPGAR